MLPSFFKGYHIHTETIVAGGEGISLLLKFIYSEKATEFENISQLHNLLTSKNGRFFFLNFVTFSEYMNFIMVSFIFGQRFIMSFFKISYSEVPNRRACSLRFFRFSFHPAHVINKKFQPCSFIPVC